MWMNEYMSGRSFRKEGAAAGEVRAAAKGSVSVSATSDYRGVPTAAPAGIAYVPAVGSQAIVAPCESGAVCLGVIADLPESLEPGELMLYSAGGARIVLKNDGRVLINGREVS